ncbi:hypothetical protein MRX96_046031 [Rhipicephalus microplus]
MDVPLCPEENYRLRILADPPSERSSDGPSDPSTLACFQCVFHYARLFSLPLVYRPYGVGLLIEPRVDARAIQLTRQWKPANARFTTPFFLSSVACACSTLNRGKAVRGLRNGLYLK